MKMKSIISALLLLGTLGSAQTIKIGLVLPISGAMGGFGELAKKGFDLAYEQNNKTKNGDQIEVIFIDNKSDKIESANAIQKLISSDRVNVVIGPLTSTNTLAMTKIADDNQTPLIAPVATNDRVTRGKRYVSRISFADSFQGVVAANFASNELKAKTAAILLDNSSDYSIGLAKSFRDQFKKNGGKVVIETHAQAGTKDFKAQLSSIKAKNPGVLFLPIYANEGALIALQAKQLNMNIPVVGGDGLAAGKVFFEVGKESVEGFKVTDYYSPNSKQTPRGEAFIKDYQAKYNEGITSFGAMFADAYDVAFKAIEECGNQNRECINDKIRNVQNYQGASGVFSLNNGESIRSAVINEVQNGQLVYRTTVEP